MQANQVEIQDAEAFIAYCRKYGPEHDDSYTGPDDLNAGTLASAGNPSYLLYGEDGEIIGAASLMLGGFRETGKGRMRIYHCLEPVPGHYKLLLDAILQHTEGIGDVYLFLPDKRKAEAEILAGLGFAEWRRCYILDREAEGSAGAVFPEGFHLEEFIQGRDEETWRHIMNTCFAHLAGHTGTTTEIVRSYFTSEKHLPGGLKLLWKNGEAVGAVHTVQEDGETAFVEQVAVLPEYQRQGLGRQLLRAGMQKAREVGFENIRLSVNGENEKAVALYLDEGFTVTECMICYNLHLNN